MLEEYPDYRVFWSTAQLRGSCVFEIFPGDFAGEVTWGNRGSAYIQDVAFEPFIEILRAIAPHFDWNGETGLDRRASVRLIGRLEVLADSINRARKVSDLHAAFGNRRLRIEEGAALVCRARLRTMIPDLHYLAQTAIDRRTGLCCWDCDMECDGTGAFRFSRATVLGSQIDSAS